MGLVSRMLRAIFNLGLLVGVAGLALSSGLYLYVLHEYGERLDRRYPELVQDSYVYDVDGNKVGTFEVEQSRNIVDSGELGENLPRAVIAVEDRRFYDHFGVDLEGVSRAAWTDIRAWSVQEGGSTITEQLMKNLFIPPDQRPEISFWRRLHQSMLAFAYERRHTKKEILTAYLNTVYFGDGAYGAEEASKRYFGKSADELTISEAATLAGFLHAPSTYLTKDEEGLERASERRNEVLSLMKGQGMISAGEYREATEEPLEYAPEPPPENPDYEPFLEKVRREVEARLGPKSLERGGLRIYTTLDPGIQQAAVESTEQVLSDPDDPSGAIATVEPQTGAIRALAGQEEDFNLALDARRQPGSSFKPIVLATALREYISPETTYVSRELNVRFQDKEYVIGNYDSINRGTISISEAMAESDNTVFVQLAVDLGLGQIVQTARDLGVTTQVDPYPSAAIGGLGAGVNVLDMASAYATFAGGGIHREPYSVERVGRNYFGGEESVYDHRVIGERVMSGNQAAMATDVLRRVVESGTASRFHDLDEEIGRPSAGKTGTTDDFVDAWYVGYTRRLSTAVWIGYPEGRRPMIGVQGIPEVNGETLPLDLWSRYMALATVGEPPVDFREPDYREFSVWDRGHTMSEPVTPLSSIVGGG